MAAKNLIIVDDHQLVRNGLREMLSAHGDLAVVGDFATGREALQALAQGLACDVLLLDLTLGEGSGLDVLRSLRQSHEAIAVLVLSGHAESQFGVNVLRAGAQGYISKGSSEAELLRAIRQVARGSKYVSAEMAGMLVEGQAGGNDGPLHARLSEREFQILMKLAEGVSATEIANTLGLSVKTVSTYRTRILEKMNMNTNADLVKYAISSGLRTS